MDKTIKIGFIALTLAALGSQLNWLVILSNGGMPVSGLTFIDRRWVPLTDATQFNYLADILPYYLSIGDIFMFAAVAYLLYGIISSEVKIRCVKVS